MLIGHFVVKLNLSTLDNRPKQARAPIGGCLFGGGEAFCHILPYNLLDPRAGTEMIERIVDVIGQDAERLIGIGRRILRAFETSSQERVDGKVRIGIRRNRAHLDPR